MEVTEAIGIPLIVFMVFVAPIWVIMHYRTLGKKSQGLSVEEHTKLQQLNQVAEQMSSRIETLEKILDAETPDWRKKYE
ncbi:MAG: envelope stress response membrane protein PspB [Gammaproteobacteria bacterium]|nr:envelope stress response membrane protein PspB [Gammaproteobacteria bacterium]